MVPPLISTEELAAALSSAAPVLLDVRWTLASDAGRRAYIEAHLPGAVFVDLETDLAAPPGPGRHPLPEADRFAAAMRRAGVSSALPVVVYDAGPGTSAARAWWTLRYFGHEDVRLLDGGFAAWVAEGRPVTAALPAPTPGDLVAHAGGMPVLDAERAARLPATGVLLDVRAAERYSGESEPVDPVAGHIPGARNLPTAESVDSAGRLLPAARLRQRFAAAGVRPGMPVGAYCGSGVTAAHTVLALEVAGISCSLYPGSWSEWITDPSRPVATGRTE